MRSLSTNELPLSYCVPPSKKSSRAESVLQWLACLPRMHEAPGSIFSTALTHLQGACLQFRESEASLAYTRLPAPAPNKWLPLPPKAI